jgi:1-aminocyclopropane-1-carboxylate deaminase/D-cysteine desulfhydrase-like pyridoxal-dependent ACC family enzyme
MTELTPVHQFPIKGGTFWAKRDDLACYTGPEWPSGSKVRQYAAMIAANPGKPMIVGCSAHSAMQIYVAAAAKLNKTKGIVYTAARAQRTDATAYAKRLGVELHEERPAYLNVVQSRAKARAGTLRKGYVKWDEKGAVVDAANQVNAAQLVAVQRIVIPTGSGLTAAGVLAGIYLSAMTSIKVLCVAVSPMADKKHIESQARQCIDAMMGDGRGSKHRLPSLSVIRAKSKYDQWEAAILPDGTPLDPYYAAKAMPYVKAGDLFWLPGLRPVTAMPEKCRKAIIALQQQAYK